MTTKQQVLEIIYQLDKHDGTFRTDDLIHRIKSEVSEPRVKQFEWVQRNEMFYITSTLDNAVYYEILCKLHEVGNYFITIHNGKVDICVSDTLDEAKAFAQQHFEELIKSCLEGEQ